MTRHAKGKNKKSSDSQSDNRRNNAESEGDKVSKQLFKAVTSPRQDPKHSSVNDSFKSLQKGLPSSKAASADATDLNFTKSHKNMLRDERYEDDNGVIEGEDGTLTGGYDGRRLNNDDYDDTTTTGSRRDPQPARRTRSGSAGNRSAMSSNSNSSSRAKKQDLSPSEALLENLIECAQFELQHDPYRGMLLDQQQQETAGAGDAPRIDNPWKQCVPVPRQTFQDNFQSNTDAILGKKEVFGGPAGLGPDIQAQAWVQVTTNCVCPTLKRWTEEAIQKQSKKKSGKKRKNSKDNTDPAAEEPPKPPPVGQRPLDPNMRCACDYNPYCRGTVGGVINTIWQEKAEEVLAKKLEQKKNYEELLRAQEEQSQTNNDGGSSKPKAIKKLPHLSQAPKGKKSRVTEPEPSKPASKPDPGPVINIPSDDEEVDSMDVDSHLSNTKKEETEDANNNKSAAVTFENIEYAPNVKEQLKGVRPSISVSTEAIHAHLCYVLSLLPDDHEANTNNISAEALMTTFQKWQKDLIFENPHKPKEDDAARTQIALPPGISNLGATCYLNTQLQCLAQNKAFLKGMFAWRSSLSSSKKGADAKSHAGIMNNVLTQLQSLLAQMVEGSQRTITTLEFSTALGLEHDEQQDPNEFARLLFERMHDAFQQQPSLQMLLPSLFEGSTTNETICLKCEHRSTREEKFMDLNLPIVKPPPTSENDKGSSGNVKNTLYHYFKPFGAAGDSTDADTDVQFCLDEYSTHETLEGDNQYHCGHCGCKQDATRETILGKLPPVLNIQLSRYVFDRKTFTKKKLTDKVLLPRKLRVRTKVSDEAGDAFSTKRYVLCAVMKHHGSSAYRGHYVAEVIDFLSGQWFEFNDEQVTLLPNGPSCSYEPSFDDESSSASGANPDGDESSQQTDKKRKGPKLEGSSDAYNMYYVEETYLAETAVQTIQGLEIQHQQLEQMKNELEEEIPADVLQAVARERTKLYFNLGEMCHREGDAHIRIEHRKTGLKNMLVPREAGADESSSLPVWVSADLFRRFMSGKDRLQDLFGDPPGSQLLRHKHLLCNHAEPGLHPRIARRGKLLPRYIYQSYERLIGEEHERWIKDNGPLLEDNEETKEAPHLPNNNLNDCIITPKDNMHCAECAESYHSHLEEKLELVRVLKRLYDLLDTKNNDGLVYLPSGWETPFSDSSDSSEDEVEAPKIAFVALRKSLTALRKLIETGFLKSVAISTTSTANSSPSSAISIDDVSNQQGDQTALLVGDPNVESVSEGLDALDISMFTRTALRDNADFDEKINSSVTCHHGNCVALKSKVRLVTPEFWGAIKKVCPDAIAHKLVLPPGHKVEMSCPRCKWEEEDKKITARKLDDWYQDSLTRGQGAIKDLTDPNIDGALLKLYESSYRMTENSEEAVVAEYVPVAREDIALWRKILKLVSNMTHKKSTEDGHSTKSKIENLLSSRTQQWAKHTTTTSSLEDGFLRRLKCSRHGLALPIFESYKPASGNDSGDSQKNEDDKNPTLQLVQGVRLLTKTQYQHVVESMVAVCKLVATKNEMDQGDSVVDLSQEDEDMEVDSKPPEVYADEPATVDSRPLEVYAVADGHQSETTKDKQGNGQLIRMFSPYDPPLFVRVVPHMCDDEECCSEVKGLKAEEDSVESPSAHGPAKPDIITIDSDVESDKNTFKLKIFEVKSTQTCIDNSIVDLQEAQVLPGMTNTDPFVRRSTRMRSTKYPYNSILGQDTVDVAMDHNFAAIRLLLLQQNDTFPLDQRLFLYYVPQDFGSMESSEDEPPKRPTILPPREIQFESNEKVLQDIYVEMTADEKLDKLGVPASSLIMLRQSNPEAGIPNEALMDVLLETANTISKDNGEKKGKKGKSAERGFRGTLLSSFRPNEGEEEAEGNPSKEEDKAASDSKETKADSKTVTDDDQDQKLPAVTVQSLDGASPEKTAAEPARKKAKTAEMAKNGNKEHCRTSQAKEQRTVPSSVLESIGTDNRKEKLAAEVSKKLLEMFGDREERCLKAAEWAIKSEPTGTSLDALVGVAANRFLESSS